ncbi:MAG: ADP-ribosylglycohydrolase family protein, partial [Chloroflexota bacterium]
MLVELAVGDAYGAGFEYTDVDFVNARNNLSRYIKHPRHNIIPGYYTDDTQMSLAIAELLVSGDPWTPLNLAKKFVEVFKRDPREGYAGRFYQFLQDTPDGEMFLADIRPDSDKSGAAMRAAPIGVLADTAEVIEKCKVQAAVTHNTPDG